MAYAALLSLAHTLDQLLIHHQSFLDHHKKKKIQSVHEKAVLLSTFLEEFPTEATRLEARITVAANEVEDIFEYHILDKILGSTHGKPPSSVSIFFPSLLMSYSQKKSKEYFAIREIKSLLKEAMKMKSMCTSDQNPIMATSSTHAHRAMNVHGLVVGFEKDLREIQERIHGDSAKLEVIPIVGMGGIGKTTLARYALHHPLNLEHFDVFGWVTISQNYDKASILLSLLNSIDVSSKLEHFDNESLLQERVYKYLKGRRFVVVIDDIWNSQPWDDLRRVFPDDSNGSRIIVTTRDIDVASYVQSSTHLYEMNLMDVDLSWNLLRRKVLEEEECPPELEEIGRQIAEKCRGLPLAIVMIAGVLSKVSRTEEAWRKIGINVNEAVSASDEPFTEILSLSYTCLPHHLRPCFLYIGGFPEDSEIHISELIRMWVAEGFLKPNGSKDIEKVGEDYLEDLAKRSLVLINKKRYNGRIKSIKMHDLLRDLCLRKAADEKFLDVIHKRRGSSVLPIEKSRRVSFLSNVKDHFLNMDDSSIHTILAFNNAAFGSWKRCRLLRVVNLSAGEMRLLDDKIGELLHLRYFAIAFEDYGNPKVVEYFSTLVNLQTLIIGRPWYSFKLYLPLGIWRMRELRHVIVFDGVLPDTPAETNCDDDTPPLQNLHTLKRMLDFRCSEGILKMIPNLKKLGIAYSQTRLSEYDLNNLVHLQKLEKLNIQADLHDHIKSDWVAFPMTLKKLTLGGTQIPWEEMSSVGSLPNLQVLKLKRRACSGSVWETKEGEFCQLKLLVIHFTDPNVWITESSHFPRLERLTLRSCHNLREIPGDIGDIATLQLIEVMRCAPSVVESAKCIEEEQHSYGNYILQLHLEKPAHT